MGESESSAIDDVRRTIVEIVRGGLAERPAGLHLTFLGSEFARKKNAPFEQYMNILAINGQIEVPISYRKMTPFIRKYCSDIVEISDSSGGALLVRLKDSTSSEEPLVISATSHKFKRGIWSAFLRPLPEGYRRFINVDNLGYTDVKRKPSTGPWVELQKQFINETPIDEPIDGPKTQAQVQAWAIANNVDVEILLDRGPSGSFDGANLSDLIRILHVLPDDVVERWMIPAEVLKHLK